MHLPIDLDWYGDYWMRWTTFLKAQISVETLLCKYKDQFDQNLDDQLDWSRSNLVEPRLIRVRSDWITKFFEQILYQQMQISAGKHNSHVEELMQSSWMLKTNHLKRFTHDIPISPLIINAFHVIAIKTRCLLHSAATKCSNMFQHITLEIFSYYR